jgi:hypothetical protein
MNITFPFRHKTDYQRRWTEGEDEWIFTQVNKKVKFGGYSEYKTNVNVIFNSSNLSFAFIH